MTTAENSKTAPMNPLSADAFSSMFQAVSGLRNLRAALAMLSCFALSVVASGLLWILLGKGVAGFFLGGLLAVFLVLSGIHAGGLLLMDQARQASMRSVSEAIVSGMWCVPKSLLLAIGLVVAAMAVHLLIALLFFICKLPGLGPLLYAILFPVTVVIAGLTFTGLFMGMMIALAALWEGATVSRSFAKAFGVLRSRLVETALLSFVVLVLASLVFFFVGGVLMTGFLPALGLSASMLDASPEMFGSFGSMMMGSGGRSGLGGYALAGSFGSAFLFALTMTLVFQVWLLGVNLLYLKVTEGLDASATEGELKEHLAEVRRKAAKLGGKAKQAAEQAREYASPAVEKPRTSHVESAANLDTAVVAGAAGAGTVASGTPSAYARTDDSTLDARPLANCPTCSEEILPDDIFCGACGHRLKKT